MKISEESEDGCKIYVDVGLCTFEIQLLYAPYRALELKGRFLPRQAIIDTGMH